jgi:hypothetical protein
LLQGVGKVFVLIVERELFKPWLRKGEEGFDNGERGILCVSA